MWRYVTRLPERGRIGIFNRSYYEEVLVVRVHEEILNRQRLPSELVTKRIWDERLADIANFEDYLTRQGTLVLKFFLHVSKKEQRKRFMERLDRPDKNWKFSMADVRERRFWNDYMDAYEDGSGRPRPSVRRGSWCPPTTSGSPGSSSRPRSWKRSSTSTSTTPRSTRPRRRSSRRRARSSSARSDAVTTRSMDASASVTILGGLGLFLLGIHHLTEGIKGLAGDSLRRALQRLVAGRFSAVAAGAFFTAVIQSSTTAILTVIGFVSAGLVTFAEATGMIVGATLGTTSTIWLVALFGLRFRISAAAMPMLGVGALLWLIARGRTRSLGAILAGFGLIFTGIDYLQTGMAGISWNLDALAGTGAGAKWILAGVGVAMSIVMQSSTAAGATTLVALNAGSVTFPQACAMVVGQAWAPRRRPGWWWSGNPSRRAAGTSSSAWSSASSRWCPGPLTAASDCRARLDDPDGVLALATFSSLFKSQGSSRSTREARRIRAIHRAISGTGVNRPPAGSIPTLAEAGAPVAFGSTWRAILEVARRRRRRPPAVAGEPSRTP
jgi:Na/Pi-cotransporter